MMIGYISERKYLLNETGELGHSIVTPAKAGVQKSRIISQILDSRLRGNDGPTWSRPELLRRYERKLHDLFSANPQIRDPHKEDDHNRAEKSDLVIGY